MGPVLILIHRNESSFAQSHTIGVDISVRVKQFLLLRMLRTHFFLFYLYWCPIVPTNKLAILTLYHYCSTIPRAQKQLKDKAESKIYDYGYYIAI